MIHFPFLLLSNKNWWNVSWLDSPQLIDYAKKGDTDEKAMKMASFWLTVSICPSAWLLEVLARFSKSTHVFLFVSVCMCSGKGPCPKALQGPCTEVRDSGQGLHEDGTHPQQAEPGQGKDGGPGVQRQPFPTPLSCQKTQWTLSHQPAAQRLQTGAGRTDTLWSFIEAMMVWYRWCSACCKDDAH